MTGIPFKTAFPESGSTWASSLKMLVFTPACSEAMRVFVMDNEWPHPWGMLTTPGMIASVIVMNLIYWPTTLAVTQGLWIKLFGSTPDGKPLEVFWPWFTLIGTLTTLSVAALVKTLWPQPILPETTPRAEATVH